MHELTEAINGRGPGAECLLGGMQLLDPGQSSVMVLPINAEGKVEGQAVTLGRSYRQTTTECGCDPSLLPDFTSNSPNASVELYDAGSAMQAIPESEMGSIFDAIEQTAKDAAEGRPLQIQAISVQTQYYGDNIDEMSLGYCGGALCCFSGLYCKTPDCLGCSQESMLGPFHCSSKCYLKQPILSCMFQDRLCCFVCTGAMPRREAAPCNCGILGILCWPTCGACCKPLPELIPDLGQHPVANCGRNDLLNPHILTEQIRYCGGMLCCNSGVWCRTPECLGCSHESVLFCVHCQCNSNMRECSRSCKPCCFCQQQMCCSVFTGALPTIEQAPLNCGLLGIMCYPVCGFCKKMGKLTGQLTLEESMEIEAGVNTAPGIQTKL